MESEVRKLQAFLVSWSRPSYSKDRIYVRRALSETYPSGTVTTGYPAIAATPAVIEVGRINVSNTYILIAPIIVALLPSLKSANKAFV
jgi:hypothetical protein